MGICNFSKLQVFLGHLAWPSHWIYLECTLQMGKFSQAYLVNSLSSASKVACFLTFSLCLGRTPETTKHPLYICRTPERLFPHLLGIGWQDFKQRLLKLSQQGVYQLKAVGWQSLYCKWSASSTQWFNLHIYNLMCSQNCLLRVPLQQLHSSENIFKEPCQLPSAFFSGFEPEEGDSPQLRGNPDEIH